MSENQNNNVLKDIESFKKKINRKYNVNIHFFIKEMHNRVSLSVLEKMCIDSLHEEYPEYNHVKSLKSKNRIRHVTMFRQIFLYLSVNTFGYRNVESSRHIKRHHATSIHSIKVCENYIFTNCSEFNTCLNSVQNKISQYVGNISENNKGENNSKSNAFIVQRERKNISTITEV